MLPALLLCDFIAPLLCGVIAPLLCDVITPLLRDVTMPLLCDIITQGPPGDEGPKGPAGRKGALGKAGTRGKSGSSGARGLMVSDGRNGNSAHESAPPRARSRSARDLVCAVCHATGLQVDQVVVNVSPLGRYLLAPRPMKTRYDCCWYFGTDNVHIRILLQE